ncbi:hypothetical protein Clo1100_1346 [Clostridium sp. BNL1100]|nr:hypothetical protein Clo1100_1346 [Clostridium sp. BNL1100]
MRKQKWKAFEMDDMTTVQKQQSGFVVYVEKRDISL